MKSLVVRLWRIFGWFAAILFLPAVAMCDLAVRYLAVGAYEMVR